MLLNYRRDIDGLRAIAVLMVVFFHAGFQINGGFIGVDIFFVISGFLIASLIQKHILADKFSFLGFYVHRIRRILPAFLFVSLISLIVGWFVLLPDYYEDAIRSIFYSILQYSNFFYLKITSGYFSANADDILFLHTWSLSVETQFYILIPVLLFFLFKYTYKTKYFNIICFSLLFLSIGLSEYLARNYPMQAYFLLPARFFELLMGVVLALNYKQVPVLKNNVFNNALAVLALGLIFLPAFLIHKGSYFPGLNAFYPCLGACLIIYLGLTEKQTFVTKLLSTKPFVAIGLISYSLYLWHWVILVMLKLAGVETNTIEKLALILVMIILAALTWKFVEQPFRKRFRWKFLKTFLILLVIPFLLMQVAKIMAKKTDGFTQYRFNQEQAELILSQQGKVSSLKRLCHSQFESSVPYNDCYFGLKDKEKAEVLLFGDSVGNVNTMLIEKMLQQANLKGYPLTASSFLYLKNMDLSVETSEFSIADKQLYKNLLSKEINENTNYKYVVISGYFIRDYNVDAKNFENNLLDTTNWILSKNITPVIIKQTTVIENSLVNCAGRNALFNLTKDCSIYKKDINPQVNKVNKFIDQLKTKYQDQIIVIDPNKVLCDEVKCKTFENNTAFYYDGIHLSLEGIKLLGDKYLEQYGNPFKVNN